MNKKMDIEKAKKVLKTWAVNGVFNTSVNFNADIRELNEALKILNMKEVKILD
jgi:hypothetical protein